MNCIGVYLENIPRSISLILKALIVTMKSLFSMSMLGKQDHVEFNYLIYRIFFEPELTIPISTYAAAVMLRILLCTVCREEGGHCTQVADATNIFIFLDFN